METLAQQPGPLAHSLDDIYELEKAARRVAGEHITRAHRLS